MKSDYRKAGYAVGYRSLDEIRRAESRARVSNHRGVKRGAAVTSELVKGAQEDLERMGVPLKRFGVDVEAAKRALARMQKGGANG